MASPTRQAAISSHPRHQSPTRQLRRSKESHSSFPSSPLARQQAVRPGPNAFTAEDKEEQIQNGPKHTELHRRPSVTADGYSVSMYKGMEPSPKFRGGPFPVLPPKIQNSPVSTCSRGFSETTSRSSGNTFWQQVNSQSGFSKRLQQERDRFDPDDANPVSPQEQADERLKLVPSPKKDDFSTPTYRMQLDERSKTDPGSSVDHVRQGSLPKPQISRRDDPRRTHTPPPLKLHHSHKVAIGPPSASPRKKFFGKFGLGGPSSKLTSQKTQPQSDPVKPDLSALRNVPSKAARLLGTQSLGSRHPNPNGFPDGFESQGLDDGDDEDEAIAAAFHSTPSIERLRRAASAPSKQPTFTVQRESVVLSPSQKRDSKVNLYNTDISDATATPERSLVRDEDRPPTPPSKSTLHERYPEQAKAITESGGPSTGSSRAYTDESLLRKSYDSREEGIPKLKRAGYRSPLVHQFTSGENSDCDRDMNVSEEDRGGNSSIPNNADTAIPRGPNPTSQFARISETGYLPATVYSPRAYPGSFRVPIPSPHSQISVSPSQLRPAPLTVPPHLRLEQSSSSSSDAKSRDASNSTSASVPVYLETQTPSTANPSTATSYPIMSSKLLPASPPIVHGTAPVEGATQAFEEDRHFDTSTITSAAARGDPDLKSLSSSRLVPSYYLQSDDIEDTPMHTSPLPRAKDRDAAQRHHDHHRAHSKQIHAEEREDRYMTRYHTESEHQDDHSQDQYHKARDDNIHLCALLNRILKSQSASTAHAAETTAELRRLHDRVDDLSLEIRAALRGLSLQSQPPHPRVSPSLDQQQTNKDAQQHRPSHEQRPSNGTTAAAAAYSGPVTGPHGCSGSVMAVPTSQSWHGTVSMPPLSPQKRVRSGTREHLARWGQASMGAGHTL